MKKETSQKYAAAIERSLELVAEHGDPTHRVYERLFNATPELKNLFRQDSNDAVKGEMLSRVFETVLDFVGDRKYADHLIGTEMITHEGYDVPRSIFSTFFTVVAEVVEEALGPDWSPEIELAWKEVLSEIDAYTKTIPLVHT